MRGRRRRVSTGEGGGSSGQLLALALFIMLLAFFIVLNAISTFEETKIRPTISSIEGAFSKNASATVPGEQPPLLDMPVQASGGGTVLDKVEGLFSAEIPDFDSVKSDRRGEMHVRVSYKTLEDAVLSMGSPRPAQGNFDNNEAEKFEAFFVPALVSLLMLADDGVHYRMDILINSAEDPARLENQDPQALARLMKRYGKLAARLEEEGLPPRLMSIGLQKGPDGYVDILFRPHEPYSPPSDERLLLETGGADE